MAHITKVIFEYSDGTKKYIEREALEQWIAFNSIVAIEAERGGINPPWEAIAWKKIGKDCLY